jgi:Tol biopolymer transport system component
VASTAALARAESASRRQFRLAAAVLGPMIVLAGLGFAIYRGFTPSKPGINPLNMLISRLTEDGAAMSGAISPDGRYVAFVKRGEQQSLWVKQIATGSEAQVVDPGPGSFSGRPTFSPDGNYIYFEHSDPQNEAETVLLSVPSLGGTPQRILSDLSTPVSFSPDGKRVAFAHFDAGASKAQLVIAGSDGTGRRVIAQQEGFGLNNASLSWSADGRLIAVPQYELGKQGLSNVLIFTPDSVLTKTFSFPFLVDGVSWLPDGSGMFLISRSAESSFRRQIKFQPYPSGDLQNITNDLNQYQDVSVTSDSKALATVQEQNSSAIYIGNAPARWPGEVKLSSTPVTPGQDEGGWVNWGGDGKIYFTDSNFRAFRMNPDGSSRAQVPDRDTHAGYPISCGPNALVYGGLRDNTLNLFHQDLTTGEIKQLTREHDTERPACTNDGTTVYYVDFLEGPALRRVSSKGGPPEDVDIHAVSGAALSPDGKRIAFFQSSAGTHTIDIIVQDTDGKNRIVLPSTGVVSSPVWAPEGRALIVNRRTGAGTNLFYQPLDGSNPTQITHFDMEPLFIQAYSFSSDGKQIAIGRARLNDSNIVMFSNFR